MSNTDGIKPYFNINKICRVCLTETENMRSIFNSNLIQSEIPETNVSEALFKVTDVKVDENDGFPNLICAKCVLLLQDAYKFKITFEQSFKCLEEYKTSCIKEEIQLDFVAECKEDYSCDVDEDPLKFEIGKRQTSRKQIEKRLSSSNELKPTRRRTRKAKYKEQIEESEPDLECSEEKPVLHPCPICTKEFSALELRAHAHTHKALKKYLSIPSQHKVTPNTKFYIKRNSYKTNVSLHNMPVKLHNCVMCGKGFTSEDLRLHLETHRNQKEFKCDQCERVFKKLNHLNTHRVKHLKEFPFKCEQCGKGFVIKTNYDCHVLTHNTNQELPHECTHCLKRFSNPEHLNRHIIIHTENVSYSVKYRVCKCHHCLKTFKDRAELKSHECVPIEQAVNTRFPCKICNKIFKNSSGLYNHNRNIHKLKGAKVLCSVCGNHVSNIYNHMMRHTGEKPFQCNQCGKKFVGKPQLRQHLLVHSGLKPFVCSVCAKAFNNLYNLQVHERIHKGDRCHICTICNKGFLEKSYLKKHMNVHTKL